MNKKRLSSQDVIEISCLNTGLQLKEIRRQKGLTQQDFADLLGVEKLTVARWESGDRKIKGAAFVLVNLIFKHDLWKLFGVNNE